ncbi:MAG: hypothetical protein IT323_08485 [Anaerolineae bacterium]|nr:hypothetical protein [Anaerolineae bacterium]
MAYTYYPQQTLVLGMATLIRERRLPPNAIGEVRISQYADVEPNTEVLRGAIPGEFILIDALKPLRLKQAEDITPDMLRVQAGEVVDTDTPILTIGSGRRARSVFSPVPAIFARLDGGQVILQVDPMPVSVLALTPGRVTAIKGENAVVIETTGALVQGAWGNGKSAFATLTLEPAGGIETLEGDSLLQEQARTAVVMRGPIRGPNVFAIAAAQSIQALIAPSMSSGLREIALRQTIPVILTEGFGELEMSEIVYNLLRGNMGRTVAVDAVEPSRWTGDRPEIVIPIGSGGGRPPAPVKDQPLAEGALVRIARAPRAGVAGRVVRLVEAPRTVENGLRLVGAEVQISPEQTVFVPLANVELLGRPLDGSAG